MHNETQGVTQGHNKTQGVTQGHNKTQGVTQGHNKTRVFLFHNTINMLSAQNIFLFSGHVYGAVKAMDDNTLGFRKVEGDITQPTHYKSKVSPVHK